MKKFCKNKINVKKNKNENLFLKKSFNKIVHVKKKFSSEIIIDDIIKMNLSKEDHYEPDILTFLKNWIRNLIHNYNVISYFLKKFILKLTNSTYKTPIDRIVSQHQKIPFGIRLKDINNEILNYKFKDKIIIKQILKNAFLIEKKN